VGLLLGERREGKGSGEKLREGEIREDMGGKMMDGSAGSFNPPE